MDKDKLKVILAVVALIIAGVVIAWQFTSGGGGGGGGAAGPDGIWDDAPAPSEGQPIE